MALHLVKCSTLGSLVQVAALVLVLGTGAASSSAAATNTTSNYTSTDATTTSAATTTTQSTLAPTTTTPPGTASSSAAATNTTSNYTSTDATTTSAATTATQSTLAPTTTTPPVPFCPFPLTGLAGQLVIPENTSCLVYFWSIDVRALNFNHSVITLSTTDAFNLIHDGVQVTFADASGDFLQVNNTFNVNGQWCLSRVADVMNVTVEVDSGLSLTNFNLTYDVNGTDLSTLTKKSGYVTEESSDGFMCWGQNRLWLLDLGEGNNIKLTFTEVNLCNKGEYYIMAGAGDGLLKDGTSVAVTNTREDKMTVYIDDHRAYIYYSSGSAGLGDCQNSGFRIDYKTTAPDIPTSEPPVPTTPTPSKQEHLLIGLYVKNNKTIEDDMSAVIAMFSTAVNETADPKNPMEFRTFWNSSCDYRYKTRTYCLDFSLVDSDDNYLHRSDLKTLAETADIITKTMGVRVILFGKINWTNYILVPVLIAALCLLIFIALNCLKTNIKEKAPPPVPEPFDTDTYDIKPQSDVRSENEYYRNDSIIRRTSAGTYGSAAYYATAPPRRMPPLQRQISKMSDWSGYSMGKVNQAFSSEAEYIPEEPWNPDVSLKGVSANFSVDSINHKLKGKRRGPLPVPEVDDDHIYDDPFEASIQALDDALLATTDDANNETQDEAKTETLYAAPTKTPVVTRTETSDDSE